MLNTSRASLDEQLSRTQERWSGFKGKETLGVDGTDTWVVYFNRETPWSARLDWSITQSEPREVSLRLSYTPTALRVD